MTDSIVQETSDTVNEIRQNVLENKYKASLAAFDAWERVRDRTDHQLYDAIGQLAEFVAAAGNDHEILASFAADKGVRATKASTPYTVITKLVITTDRKKASKYAMVLQLAFRHGVEPKIDKVAEFIKGSGGIEACVRKFRDLPQMPGSPKRSGRPSAFSQAAEKLSTVAQVETPKNLNLTAMPQGYFVLVGICDVDGQMRLLQKPVTDVRVVHKAIAALASEA